MEELKIVVLNFNCTRLEKIYITTVYVSVYLLLVHLAAYISWSLIQLVSGWSENTRCHEVVNFQ